MYTGGVSAPRHPFREIARFYFFSAVWFGALGVVLNGCGVAFGVGLLWPLLPLVVGAIVLLSWVGQRIDRHARAAIELGRASDFIARGSYDEAAAEHAKIPAGLAQTRYVARRLALQRGFIALARGDAARAEEVVGPAVEPRITFVTENAELFHRFEALALRALARAGLGRNDLAEADARAVESAAVTTPNALARAALARAVIHARRGDRTALGAFLEQKEAFILEHTLPRERMLLRSLSALAHPEGGSVYREPAPSRENERDGTPDWIARFAPHAPRLGEAMFAERNDTAAPAVDDAAALRVGAQRLQAANALSVRRSRFRTLAIWLVLVVMFLAIWQLLAPAEQTTVAVPPPPDPPPEPTNWAYLVALAVVPPPILFAFIRLLFLRVNQRERRNIAAVRAHAEGDKAGAERTLQAAMKDRNTVIALQARLALVTYENQRANFAAALALTDESIALATRTKMLLHYTRDAILPSLIVERAVALAAQGHTDDANTELALTLRTNPWYTHAAAATFRVQLIGAARRGDLAGAAEIARTRTPDLPLDLRTDLLCDVILEANGSRTTTERRRTQRELASLPDVAAWIDAVAPGSRTAERPRIVMPVEALADEEEEADETEGWRKHAARVDDKT